MRRKREMDERKSAKEKRGQKDYLSLSSLAMCVIQEQCERE
jgi:hypothetical protein